MSTAMGRMLIRTIALAWLLVGAAWADDPVILASTGISTAPGEYDETMNRALAAELAARGVEIHFYSPMISCARPDLDAQFYAGINLEHVARTRVRSSHGDSPSSEPMSFARCDLSIWRFDEEGNSEVLFNDTVIIPLSEISPNVGTDVPPALAERIVAVVAGAQ